MWWPGREGINDDDADDDEDDDNSNENQCQLKDSRDDDEGGHRNDQ